jgi:hypothetical protein
VAAIIGDAVDGKGKGKGEGKGDSEAPPHEEIMAEIRAIRKLVGAPQQKEDVPADAVDEPPLERILRELRDLRKFLETRPANQK